MDKEKTTTEMFDFLYKKREKLKDNRNGNGNYSLLAISSTLINADYRKADEVRKETARGICEYIFDTLDYPNWTYGERCTILALYKDIAKQYGVEVEE